MTCDVCYFDPSHENMHSLLKMENEDTSHMQREILVESLIIALIIMWPEKFDFVLVPEHDVTGILT